MLCLIFFVQACDTKPVEEEDDVTPPIIEPEEPNEDPEIGLYTDKDVYREGEKILISVYGYDNTHTISILNAKTERYILGQHTPYSKLPLKRGQTEYSVGVGALRGTGEFIIYLHTQIGERVVERKVINVLGEDENDYQIISATYTSSIEDEIIKSSITIKPSSQEALTYRLYWSKEGKRLPNYTYLKEVVIGGQNEFTLDLNDNLFMPAEADGIEITVYEGLTTSTFISADTKLKLNNSNYQFNFQAFSDVHVDTLSLFSIHHSNWFQALIDVKNLDNPSSAIFTVGDHTNNGTLENYDVLFSTEKDALPNNDIPMYYAIGNHEYAYHSGIEEGIGVFLEQTKMPGVYYSVDIENHKFIVLGSESYIGEGAMSQTQIDWFSNEMKTVDQSKPTFVFIHQPLYDTVSGTLPGQNWHGFINEGDQLKAILKNYRNAIVFSGHTHSSFNETRPVSYGNGQDATFVNLASVGYLWNDQNAQELGSQGMFIEIYDDYVLLKGREFQEKAWVANAQFKIKIHK